MNNAEDKDSEKRVIRLIVNKKPYELGVGSTHGAVAATDTLAHTLRETLGAYGDQDRL